MKNKPTILIIDNSPGWTGAIKSILNAVNNIDSHFVFAIPRHSQLAPYFREKNIRFIQLPFLELRKHWSILFYFPVLIYNTIAITRFCKKHRIYLIHVNDLYNLTGILVKFFNPSIRLIQHIRLLPGSYVSVLYKIWIKLASAFADELVTVSQTSKTYITRHTSREITVVYDAVIAPEVIPAERSHPQVSFFYPANYTVGKGQELALQAFAEVIKENPNVSLTFAGDVLGQPKNVAYKEKLKDDLLQLGLQDHVTLGNFESDIFAAMSRHDAVLNFSASESFSLVCLEALLAGKVLIATDSGGPKELFEHGISGFLIDRDIPSMKTTMLLVAEDQALRSRMGAAGRQFASSKFNPRVTSRQLEQLYFKQVTKV